MAKRYSGDLQITVVYDDRGHYRASVSRGGVKLWRGAVRPPRSLTYAVDSEHGYDEAARAALAFADHDRSGIGDHAEMDDAGYKVRRVKDYWQKWPGGRIKPSRLRDRSTRRRTR